jgi:hypothetical protein
MRAASSSANAAVLSAHNALLTARLPAHRSATLLLRLIARFLGNHVCSPLQAQRHACGVYGVYVMLMTPAIGGTPRIRSRRRAGQLQYACAMTSFDQALAMSPA